MRIDFIVVFKKFCLFLDLSESTALLENDTENDTDSSAENYTENDEDTGAENDTENDLSDLVRKKLYIPKIKTLYSLRSKLYIA